MLRNLVFAVSLLSILCLISSQSIANQQQSNIITIFPKRAPKDGLSPGVRKCQKVKCDQGYFCFHGRCKKIDYGCVNINCKRSFRCSEGSCLPQKNQPARQMCKPLGFDQKKIKCDAEMKRKCIFQQSTANNVCGFSKDGSSRDFTNVCLACADSSIKFIFTVSCSLGPKICPESNQCFNGICTEMFTEPVFKNSVICNKNKDCQLNEQCAGHKCLDQRDLFNYMNSLVQNTPLRIAI